jgi:hypothetical protein
MATEKPQRSVLLIGKSRRVLDDAVAGLRDLAYQARGTNDFDDITDQFDFAEIDLVVFGGQVPPERKAELREEIAAINPEVIFVQGLAGIPGLIVKQVQAAFSAHRQDLDRAPTYAPDDRSIRVSVAQPADVTVSVWWQTSFVPPDPRSDSLVVLDDHLPRGDHTVAVPDHIPPRAAFATVQVGAAVYAFSIATDGA